MAKRAFIVVGPESSGNRFVTECFVKAGCYGDYGHPQMLDHSFDYAKDKETIVIRRSMPHGEEYPDLHRLLERIRNNGFPDVRVLVLARTQYANVRSMVYGKEKHAKSEAEAERKILFGLRRILSFLVESGLPFHFMTYETILYDTEFFTALLTEWGLDASKMPEVDKDANKKWLKWSHTEPPRS